MHLLDTVPRLLLIRSMDTVGDGILLKAMYGTLGEEGNMAINLNKPHEAFVQYMGSTIRPNVYIELGVGEGNTFNKIAPFVSRAIAVDTKIPKELEDYEVYEMETSQFFGDGWFIGEADLIFIDAATSYEEVKKDLKNALDILSDDGMIILNSTDPVSNFMQDNPAACGDVYKLVDDVEEGTLAEVNVVTLPIGDGGLSLITKKKCSRTQRRTPENTDKTGKLKPKFYVPEAYNMNTYADMKAKSPYKQF